MRRRTPSILTLTALAGYLLTVTAALPLHRCDAQRTGSGCTPVTACTHCHEACKPAQAMPGGEAVAGGIDAAVANHADGECYLCQVLAQKYLPSLGPDSLRWGEVVAEIPRATPRPAARTPSFSWSSRAPPSAA